ncbi:MAG TPA: hypothetical protein DCO80_10435 [Ornithinibacillus sp.]|nr:hypothetical protein [Ornithinibacillus sp.]
MQYDKKVSLANKMQRQPKIDFSLFKSQIFSHNNTKGKIEKSVFPLNNRNLFSWKIVKNGQTYPVYSVSENRAFERIKLLVQSTESNNYTHNFKQPSLD